MENKVVLLTRAQGCPTCQNVKALFDTLGVEYSVVDIDTDKERAAELLAVANSRSLPLMYVDDKNVAAGFACMAEGRKYAS